METLQPFEALASLLAPAPGAISAAAARAPAARVIANFRGVLLIWGVPFSLAYPCKGCGILANPDPGESGLTGG